MKELALERPPDAVACGCALTKRTKSVKKDKGASVKSRTSESTVIPTVPAPLTIPTTVEQQQRSIGRFFAHFVRKVFDSSSGNGGGGGGKKRRRTTVLCSNMAYFCSKMVLK